MSGQQWGPQLLQEQPLLVAATGVALGAILGAAFPATAIEQRYLGKNSARLVDKVKHQAQEGYEAVRDTVTKATDQASGAASQSAAESTGAASADRSLGPGSF